MSRQGRIRCAPARPPDARNGQRRLRSAVMLALVAASAACVLTAFAGPARAALSVQIAPAQVEITADRSTTSDLQISVKNHDSEPVDLKVFIRDFELSAEGGFEMRDPGGTTYSAGQWIDFPVEALRLSPDETRTFPYAIHVPADAESGGHYAAIVFEGTPADPDTTGGDTQVVIVGQVVAEVLITVPGPITRNLVVDSISVPRIAFGAGADYADVTVRNTGNVHLTPNGYVQTWGGVPASSFDQEFGQFTLLPHGSRHFRVPLENAPWLGRMRAKTELLYGPSIGVFDRSVETEVEYFVVSWKAILLLDLLLVGFDLVLFREWRRRVAARRALPPPASPSADLSSRAS